MDLFLHLREKEGFSFIFITHDLALCAQIANRIAVMHEGKIVETALTTSIVANPLHPYTKAMFKASGGHLGGE